MAGDIFRLAGYRVGFDDKVEAIVPPAPARKADEDTRRYPRDPAAEDDPAIAGFQRNHNKNEGLDDLSENNSNTDESGEEDEGEDDTAEANDHWYLQMMHAVMAGLPVADEEYFDQKDFCRVLAHIVRGHPVETFESTIRELWDDCGLEAAGVDREDFDFYADHLCSEDWNTRGDWALTFLCQARPPDWHPADLRLIRAVTPAPVAAATLPGYDRACATSTPTARSSPASTTVSRAPN